MGEAPPSERVFVSGLNPGLVPDRLKEIFGPYGTLKEVRNLPTINSCILVFETLDEAKWMVENLDQNMPEGLDTPITVMYAHPPAPAGPVKPLNTWSDVATRMPGGVSGIRPGVTRPVANAAPGLFRMMSGDANALAVAHALGPLSGAVNSIDLLKRSLLAFGSLPVSEGIRPPSCQLYVRGLPSDTTDADLLEIFAPFGAIPPRGVKAMLNAQGLCTGVAWVEYVHEADAKAALQTLNEKVWSDGSCLRIHVKFMKS